MRGDMQKGQQEVESPGNAALIGDDPMILVLVNTGRSIWSGGMNFLNFLSFFVI